MISEGHIFKASEIVENVFPKHQQKNDKYSKWDYIFLVLKQYECTVSVPYIQKHPTLAWEYFQDKVFLLI